MKQVLTKQEIIANNDDSAELYSVSAAAIELNRDFDCGREEGGLLCLSLADRLLQVDVVNFKCCLHCVMLRERRHNPHSPVMTLCEQCYSYIHIFVTII